MSVLRRIIALLVLAIAPAAATENFSGIYQGKMEGVDAQLVLVETSNLLTGEIRLANGYVIKLNGERKDNAAEGAAASVAGAASFFLEHNGERVKLFLKETGPLTGQTIRVMLEFHASAANAGSDTPPDTDRDPRLAGVWHGTEIRATGDMVLRTSIELELVADGNYREADDAGGDTITDTAQQQGRWRVDKGKLQLQRAGDTQWKSLGFYQLRGDELLLIDDDGRAQAWRRQ
jgi:hypothetical protein